MPQLDVISFLTQYLWTLVGLFLLFGFLIYFFLPKIQKQIRSRDFTGVYKSNFLSHLEFFNKILKT